MVVRFALLLALLAAPGAAAQSFTVLCPGLVGPDVQACLRGAYTPTSTYSYDRARDTLFAFVDDGDRRRITEVYAGRVLPIPVGADPTISGCNGDGDNSSSTCNGALNFNTEHAYPQSKGASTGPARSDMHHLFAARADVNSSRGNNPYGAFSNSFTTKYYRDAVTVTCPAGCPPADADTYSAASMSVAGTAYFMPRAAVRGDLARAIFYFYTIYRAQADAADPLFFDGMRETLVEWHRADPPDAAEQARSARVRFYQGNDNPFALDTSLVARAYAPSTLPVELVAFTAAADGATVRLAWTTASETNNAGFYVEHRGAVDWADVRFVPGHGTTTERSDYAAAVDGLPAGRHAFRLRQVDTDGSVRHSAVVEASVGQTTATADALARAGWSLRVAPQPAASRALVHVGVPQPSGVRVEVFDLLGRTLAVLHDGPAVAPLALAVDVSGWPNGRYVVRVAVGGRSTSRPLVVQR